MGGGRGGGRSYSLSIGAYVYVDMHVLDQTTAHQKNNFYLTIHDLATYTSKLLIEVLIPIINMSMFNFASVCNMQRLYTLLRSSLWLNRAFVSEGRAG